MTPPAADRPSRVLTSADATTFIAEKRRLVDRPLPLLRFLRDHPVRTVLAAATGFLVGVLGWAMAMMVQFTVDHSADVRRVTMLAVATAAILVFRGALSLVRRNLQVDLARRVERRLAERYLDHVTRLDLRFYEKYHTGDLLNRLRGIEVLRNALEDRFLGVTFDAVLVFIAGVLMMRYSPSLALLATAGAVVPAAVMIVSRNSIKRSFEILRDREGELSDRSMDALHGVRDMRLTHGEAWAVGRVQRAYRDLQEYRIRHILKLTLLSATTILISAVTGLAILAAGAGLVAAGRLTQGQLMFLYTMGGTMLGPLEQLAATWISFDEASVAFARYDEILHLPAEPRSGGKGGARIAGRLMLEDVTFGYRSDRPVLHDVTLDLEAGGSVSVVGESGTGKSTLLGLLSGLYAPTRGRVLVDGRDLREVDLESYRRQIGAVFQNPHLFAGTVEENIRMGRAGATAEEVRRAAALAHADEFIRHLPEGYATRVRRAGTNFSGGQVQRIAIARALIGRPKVLLLDEATGNLDAHAEAAIWATLTESAISCTRVFVTHRLSTTCQTDRVIVLDKGRVVEIGTSEELLRSRGHFYRLWKRQVPDRVSSGDGLRSL
jgi:ATP-binding cassette subfamily B protein